MTCIGKTSDPGARAWLKSVLRSVPPLALAVLIVGLCAQGLWHHLRPPPEARAVALPRPPSAGSLALWALGDPEALARLLMLWLQAYDNQPGISLPFKDLDYDKVVGWLGRILDLDPRAQYPLLAATRLYGEVPDEAKQRVILEFVYRRFLEDPDRRLAVVGARGVRGATPLARPEDGAQIRRGLGSACDRARGPALGPADADLRARGYRRRRGREASDPRAARQWAHHGSA